MFYRMRAFKVFPKIQSYNELLGKLVKSGKGELAKKLFDDMLLSENLRPIVFTCNI